MEYTMQNNFCPIRCQANPDNNLHRLNTYSIRSCVRLSITWRRQRIVLLRSGLNKSKATAIRWLLIMMSFVIMVKVQSDAIRMSILLQISYQKLTTAAPLFPSQLRWWGFSCSILVKNTHCGQLFPFLGKISANGRITFGIVYYVEDMDLTINNSLKTIRHHLYSTMRWIKASHTLEHALWIASSRVKDLIQFIASMTDLNPVKDTEVNALRLCVPVHLFL